MATTIPTSPLIPPPPLWYLPTFYGDIQLKGTGDKSCQMVVSRATAGETLALEHLQVTARKKGWIGPDATLMTGATIQAPITRVAPLLAKLLKPGRKTVSAVTFKDGKISEVTEQTFADTFREAAAPYRDPEPSSPAGSTADTPVPAALVVPPKAAVTVAVPQRGCPLPDFPNAELKARVVLNAFLNAEQQEDFARYNRFITIGATTGHRYMITSRHARDQLQRYQRQLYDLDDRTALCVHDESVPAAEEMLGLHILVSLPGHEHFLRHLEG
jgi:hypothetical protein